MVINISAQESFAKISSNDSYSLVVDVRTIQEWIMTGIPDVQNISLISWSIDGIANQDFAQELYDDFVQYINNSQIDIFFICKLGARSLAAAEAFNEFLSQNQIQKIVNCYNIIDGFEGQNGWRASNLPIKTL